MAICVTISFLRRPLSNGISNGAGGLAIKKIKQFLMRFEEGNNDQNTKRIMLRTYMKAMLYLS